MRFKVHPSGLQHCCSLLWPRLEVQRRMARRRKLAAALQVGGCAAVAPVADTATGRSETLCRLILPVKLFADPAQVQHLPDLICCYASCSSTLFGLHQL
jgi:hypothetical protein